MEFYAWIIAGFVSGALSGIAAIIWAGAGGDDEYRRDRTLYDKPERFDRRDPVTMNTISFAERLTPEARREVERLVREILRDDQPTRPHPSNPFIPL